MDQDAFAARLDRLGVVSWDTAPPERGRIRFLDGAGAVVAHARFRVILSFGPGEAYTMAWEIAAYRSAGIPFVGRDKAGEPAGRRASRDEAWQRGLTVGAATGCQGIHWASTILLAVDDLVEGASDVVRGPREGDRLVDLVSTRLETRQLRLDLAPTDKHPIYETLHFAAALRAEMLSAMLLVLEGDMAELGDIWSEVTREDVPGFISAYWKLPAWRPRADLVYVLWRRREPELEPIWLDILGAPDRRAEDRFHLAKAIALSNLDGDPAKFDDYLYDWHLAKREAERRSQARG
jgi:hypothetical protein